MKKYIFGTIILTGVLSIASFAQTREPSAPIRDYIVKTNQEVSAIEKALGNENKVTDLIGGEGMQLRVAVQHDEKKDSADAEVHDASDDVFFMLFPVRRSSRSAERLKIRAKRLRANGKAQKSLTAKPLRLRKAI